MRIRLKDEDRNVLDSAAKRTGQSTSAWARSNLLKIANGQMPTDVTGAEAKILEELRAGKVEVFAAEERGWRSCEP